MIRFKDSVVGLCCVAAIWASVPKVMGQSREGAFVYVWVAEVEGGKDDAAVGTGWRRLGEFSSQEEAEDCAAKWDRQHPNSLRLTRVREIKVRRSTGTGAVPRPSSTPRPPVPGGGGGTPPARALKLQGKTLSGNETGLQGFKQLKFRFDSNGNAVMTDARGTTTGTWYQNSTAVHLKFSKLQCDYYGTIEGNVLNGKAFCGRYSWKWSVAQ